VMEAYSLNEGLSFYNRVLLAVKHDRAKWIRCSSCSHPVWDETRHLVPTQNGQPIASCSNCRQHFCRTAACPVSLKYCGNCLCKGVLRFLQSSESMCWMQRYLLLWLWNHLALSMFGL
jgi:hypothetical protein